MQPSALCLIPHSRANCNAPYWTRAQIFPNHRFPHGPLSATTLASTKRFYLSICAQRTAYCLEPSPCSKISAETLLCTALPFHSQSTCPSSRHATQSLLRLRRFAFRHKLVCTESAKQRCRLSVKSSYLIFVADSARASYSGVQLF